MNFRPGDTVCVGLQYVGKYICMAGPETAQLLINGEFINSRIELVKDYDMARKSAADKKKEDEQKNAARGITGLSEAVKFCAPGYKENGEAYAQFAVIYGGWLTTYNGVIMYGHPVPDELQAMPHFGQLQAALKSAGSDTLSITVIDPGRLSIKAGSARYVVKCMSDYSVVVRHAPDPSIGPLASNMREGFEVMRQVASKTGEHVLTASVLIRAGDMVATDRHQVVSYWHGLGFPTLTVPADFIEAVLRIPKSLASFGYSDRSLTFYYDDHSFVRTQLYTEEWPDVNSVLPADFSTMLPIPAGFFDALDKCKPFMERPYIEANEGQVRTHIEDDVGCLVEVAGLRNCEAGIDAIRLSKLRDRVTHFDYWSDETRVAFAGENMRGVCANFFHEDEVTPRTANEAPIAAPPEPLPAPAQIQPAPEAAAPAHAPAYVDPGTFQPPQAPEPPEYTDDEDEPAAPPGLTCAGSFGPPA